MKRTERLGISGALVVWALVVLGLLGGPSQSEAVDSCSVSGGYNLSGFALGNTEFFGRLVFTPNGSCTGGTFTGPITIKLDGAAPVTITPTGTYVVNSDASITITAVGLVTLTGNVSQVANNLANAIHAVGDVSGAINVALTMTQDVLGGPPGVMWLNHFDLLPGGPELSTSFRSTSSGIGGGLTGLVIQSTTTGSTFGDGGNKVVHMAVQVPPIFPVFGVRVCYELTSSSSFITQIRLAQVQNPPSSALVLLDDATALTAPGPICVNSAQLSPGINPVAGALLLSLRLNFGSTSNMIVVRGLGLCVKNPC